MTDVRVAALGRAIESRWPGSKVVVEPYRSPDDPLIRWWVYILGIRYPEAGAAIDFGWELSRDLFRNEPMSFFMSAESPASARRILARLRRTKPAGAGRTRSVRGRSTPRRIRGRARAQGIHA
ncbi:MAG TPA: hypothetical protein VFI25_08870 [Planctomycetota bacterium]|jgi:hypothetical protein|nr:hypothetical protein [Planctomycetota bacterium]